MADETEKIQANFVSNQGYNNASIIGIRLDTKKVIDDFELYLKGIRIVPSVDAHNQPAAKFVRVGEPMANELGVQAILQFIESIVNAQVVQGNLTLEEVRRYCGQKRQELALNVGINRIAWQIKARHILPICQAAFNLYYPFMTRPQDNKERESFSTYVQRDTNTVNQGKSWFPSFGGVK